MLIRAAVGCNYQCSARLPASKTIGFSLQGLQGLWAWTLFSSRHKSPQRKASSSSTSLVTPRERVRTLQESLKHALDESKYHVEILGSYRRETARIGDIRILVTGLTDVRVPSSSRETYKQDSRVIATNLVDEGVLAFAGSEDQDTQSYAASQCPGHNVTLQYVPKSCQGAARLFLTGDNSYIRFLRLMSIEAMGLHLNLLGLWKITNTPSIKIDSASTPSRNQSTLQGVAIEKIDVNQESEGDRRMRATRQAMGLPEGLNLSLDLEASPSVNDKVALNTPLLDRQKAEADLIQRADQETSLERVSMGSNSEAEILDHLGLVWIPPQLRSVKGP